MADLSCGGLPEQAAPRRLCARVGDRGGERRRRGQLPDGGIVLGGRSGKYEALRTQLSEQPNIVQCAQFCPFCLVPIGVWFGNAEWMQNMPVIDGGQVVNWIIESGIGFVYTFLGAYVAFRFALRQDEKKRAAEALIRERERREQEQKDSQRALHEQLTAGIIDQRTLEEMFKLQSIIDELKRK